MEMTSSTAGGKDRHGVLYSLWFMTALSVVAATAVSTAYVTMRSRQQANELLARQRGVLLAAGLIADGERVTRETVRHHFEPIELAVVDLRTGEEAPDVDPYTYDQRTSAQAAGTSHQVPGNLARLPRLPHYALVYKLMAQDGQLQAIILPVEGKGLWSTLYGFLALESDLATVRGLTFYQHGETPGLGGEVDNPRWKALWRGRSAFDQAGRPAVQVIRGKAGSATEDPYRVDGISGATLTSNGVSNLIRFWLGDDGFGPYLERLRGRRSRIENGRAAADGSNSEVRTEARARRRPGEGEAP